MAGKHYDIEPSSRGELDLLLAMLNATTKMWRTELRGATDSEMRWQPAKNAHSIAMILLHIADCEDAWIQWVGLRKPMDMEIRKRMMSQEVDQYAAMWPRAPKRSKAWFLKQPAEMRKRTLADLKGLSANHLGKRGDNSYTLRWIIHRLIEHEAYHGGQMVLLRELYNKR